uniref:Uncharacterized protein n=1 Tax=Anguilla anguilla TaxID=7936 RepID=A0A0E9Q8C7_ANGAN
MLSMQIILNCSISRVNKKIILENP